LAHNAISEGVTDELLSTEATFVFPDGIERTVEYNYVLNYTDAGEIESVYILGADISHLNEIERQARELARQAHLRELRENYSSAARLSLMDHFSSILAHELNQPLTAISNYLAVSRRLLETGNGTAPPELGELFDKAGTQANRAAEIIQGLRDLAQPGRVDFSLDSINDIIAEACEMTLPDGAEDRLDLRLELVEDIEPMAVHRAQIQQLFSNMLRNSIEAMSDTETPIFRIATSRADDSMLRILVEDNGPGLSDEMRTRWMSPFVTSKDSGLGIGLSICRSIVDAHGGTMELADGALGGFCIAIELPINAADQTEQME